MKSSRKLLFGKTLLIAFTGTIFLTVLLVFLTGLSSHRTILDNSLLSLSVLAFFFFLFLAYGLYNGLDVFDNYSHKLQLTWKSAKRRTPDSWGADLAPSDIPDAGDGIAGIIISLVLWLMITIAFVILLIVLQAVVWLSVILLIMAIYWVLIRALKLIFSKSGACENDLAKSITYAFTYTILYIGWILELYMHLHFFN